MSEDGRGLTDDEKQLYDDLTNPGSGVSFGLVRCEFEGRPAAVIVNTFQEEGEEGLSLQPVAILLASEEQYELMSRLTLDGDDLEKYEAPDETPEQTKPEYPYKN